MTEIILLTENLNKASGRKITDRDLSSTSNTQAMSIASLIEESGYKFTIIDDIEYFMNSDFDRNSQIILPHWAGSSSRNRTAIATCICEAKNLYYIGNDCYSRIRLNNKSSANKIFTECGFSVPSYEEISMRASEYCLDRLSPPFIVKPNMEGSSMGINQSSIVYDRCSAEELADHLLQTFNQGVIVQEFKSGFEISMSIVVESGDISEIACGEIYRKDDPNYFFHKSYGFDEKFIMCEKFYIRPFKYTSAVRDCVHKLIRKERICEIIRLDFRVDNEKNWWLIEATPDPLLAPASSYFQNFEQSGFLLEDVFEKLVRSCIKRNSNEQLYSLEQ